MRSHDLSLPRPTNLKPPAIWRPWESALARFRTERVKYLLY
jgi:hypothetical protein